MAEKAVKRKAAAAAAPDARRLRALAGYFATAENDQADRILHERVRLGIMSALSVMPSMSFAELKELLSTTDGNLSAHARKLEDAGYIVCKKRFAGRVPRTEYSMTAEGKRVFARRLEHMEALIQAARGE